EAWERELELLETKLLESVHQVIGRAERNLLESEQIRRDLETRWLELEQLESERGNGTTERSTPQFDRLLPRIGVPM
ncbi:MAG: hypothetical protein V3T65_04705, partial [Acidobacteriota bacterium]